ncbi:hypothetical protein HWV62_22644 [Athelia sp. TMB]|nr:hypothetical protein HWV62_22644 [Athelia sp. TMB]
MRSWTDNENPKHTSFPAHKDAVVTCLIFSHGRIISASDDRSILVWSPATGELLMSLDGHDGGIWAIAGTSQNSLASGSTDRTLRIWDLTTGRCTHIFGGHTSTVRCLNIVEPEWLDTEGPGGVITREKWPKRSLVVTGSRDHSLRVWALPRAGDAEYGASEENHDHAAHDPADEDVTSNPFHMLHLEGHENAVRGLAARGRMAISGSYDCTLRVWDIITGECKRVLLYSVALDTSRNQAYSGSMDSTVRVWDLITGDCLHTLTGHTSLVGLLGISSSYLVSAAADSTLRVWDPDAGQLLHVLEGHTGAVTCFQHDEVKVLSGSDGALKIWDPRDGTAIRDLLTGITGVWQVVFEGRWCVAASNLNNRSRLDVWDFGGDSEPDSIEAGTKGEEEN